MLRYDGKSIGWGGWDRNLMVEEYFYDFGMAKIKIQKSRGHSNK